MAVGFPQFDSRQGGSGGSDVWDNGLAGELLSADFFPPAATPRLLKYWNGSAWVAKPMKRWTGAAWETVMVGKLKRWNGTSWENA